jgi:hypothetical protein
MSGGTRSRFGKALFESGMTSLIVSSVAHASSKRHTRPCASEAALNLANRPAPLVYLGTKMVLMGQAISVTKTYPGGYWEDEGYNWFSGS